jgi:hypothetical protein
MIPTNNCDLIYREDIIGFSYLEVEKYQCNPAEILRHDSICDGCVRRIRHRIIRRLYRAHSVRKYSSNATNRHIFCKAEYIILIFLRPLIDSSTNLR